MLTGNKKMSSSASISQWLRRIPWLLIPVMVLSLAIAHAQQLTGTISGIAADQSGARIAGAVVLITNDATGDRRDTKADSDGFFSVTALMPGTYTVTVSAKSFASWRETGILINQGDSRSIPNIHLKVSSDVTAITVVSGADAEVPTDNAEVSATLNNELVDSATLTGRNAAELMKMMPGVAFNNGGGAGSAYNSQTTGTNNGPAGAFSANGTQPNGSTAVILDGANLIDPGNAGTQVANINQDMTDSVKFSSASADAEYAKGPAVLQAFSKSGTQKFHGEAYLYARNTSVGYANDAFNKAEGNPIYPQHFYYVGGNVGGPIFFKNFNKNRDKLFFWGGYEKMYQTPYSAPDVMNVPTAAQMSGDFSNAGVDSHVVSTYGDAYNLPCNTNDWWQGCFPANAPWGGYQASNTTALPPNLKKYFDPNGVILSEQTVPGSTNSPAMASQKYMTPSAQNGWNNFSYAPSLPVNRWEATGKVTYALNDNNKIWGSYAYQSEADEHPIAAWWAPEWSVPYASQPSGKETAKVYLVNFTHVFSATTTNEFVFAYSNFENVFSGGNMKNVSRSALGFTASSLFQTSNLSDVLPVSAGGWQDGTPFVGYEQGDFTSGIYGANSFGKTAKSPSITDNFTKIIKTHSLKGGFFWDGQENIQANYAQGSGPNGAFNMNRWGGTSTYNTILDRLMGRIGDYTESNLAKSLVPDIKQHEWSIWGQDSWKATPKLTINLGLRADHEGQWYDKLGGTQVWDPASYNNTSSAPANTGLLWHALDSKIPVSGFASKLFFYNPRLGAAWDVFGTGKTVVRGGASAFRYQISVNDAGGAMSGPLGSFNYDLGAATGMSGFYGYNVQGGTVCNSISYTGTDYNSTTGPGTCASTKTYTLPVGLNQIGTSPIVDKQGDNKVPYAWTWSYGVAQSLPGHTVAEVSYVGSASRNQLENGSNGHIQDANPVAYGAFFQPDPQNFLYENPAPITPAAVGAANDAYNAINPAQYQPLKNYGHMYLQTHGGYANYNSLQVSAQKQSGNLFLFTNFTFGKVLGTRDGSTSNGNGNGTVVNPYSLDANYGPLAYDHTKIFNVSFSYKLPKPIHNNWVLGEAVNGWQISGYTTYQDGSPYNAGTPAMNMNYEQTTVNGATTNTAITMPLPVTAMAVDKSTGADVVAGNTTDGISTSTWFGSNQYENGIQPLVTCDPRKGRASGAYFNPKCFAAPLPPTATSFGQEGPAVWPYIRNPHYWGSDLAVFKAFKVTEAQRIELRISATNWLNHPNGQFGLAGNSDNQLLFNGLSTASALTTNSNDSTTGKPLNKVGYRWMQFAAKYYF
jgi:hypothetical protein